MSENTSVKTITNANFEEITHSGVTLVDFWAPWCYPCRMQGPILEKVASALGEKVNICKLNVDENEENREIAMKHNITGIPALLVFKDGQVIHKWMGVQQEITLISTLESFL